MPNEISISDIVITWFLFWVLTLTGLALFAGSILVPHIEDQNKLITEYQVIDKQVQGLRVRVDQLGEQLSALWVDPEYTERIARNQLNLRKAGEETISVEPLAVVPESPGEGEESLEPPILIANYKDRWWYKPFLDSQKRTWMMYLSGGLVAAGLIIAIVGKDRRLRALGF